MLKKLKQLKDQFFLKQQAFLILIFLGLLSLTVREIPFLNLYFPRSTPLVILSLGLVILFNLYWKLFFWLFLVSLTAILTLGGIITQAEALADFAFLILFILVVTEIKDLFLS